MKGILAIAALAFSVIINGVFAQDPIQLADNAAFCATQAPGLDLATGSQNKNGECSQTIQGAIPNVNNMVSTLIIEPQNGGKIVQNTSFTILLRTINLDLSFFDNPTTQYYKSPQRLNDNGIIFGHQHVTIQNLGDAQTPPDPKVFAFFLGINNNSVDGDLTVDVPGLAEVGTYRLCSISGSQGHQPVLMPVARRGAQDDCIRFQVIQATENQDDNAGNGNGGGKGNGKAKDQGNKKKRTKRRLRR